MTFATVPSVRRTDPGSSRDMKFKTGRVIERDGQHGLQLYVRRNIVLLPAVSASPLRAA
jgi:hypothetical protein